MISEKEFGKDVLGVAALVNSQLNLVDKLTTDTSYQANKINLETFIAPLRGGPSPRANQYDPVNKGYIPEELVKSMHPDVGVNLIQHEQTTVPNDYYTQQRVFQPVTPSVTPTVASAKTYDTLEEDIKSIKSLLQRIDSTFTKIAGMTGKVFNYITEKEKLNN
jgi:hypothetical protein